MTTPAPTFPTTISLVIPAWNEAAYLPRLLDTADAARARYAGGAARVEVVVADNGSTDATAEIARGRGCRVVPVEKRCIAAARNGGAAAATGELLCFCDADLRLHLETFNHVAAVMARPDAVGGGTGLTMERWSMGTRFVWGLIVFPLRAFGYEGGVWFCRRTDFAALGGYDEALRAAEDIEFMRRLKRLGRSRVPRQRLFTRRAAARRGIVPAITLNSTRKWDAHGEWHVVRDVLGLLPRLVRGRRALDAYVQRYWYEGR
jgi:glycosyltransferase involved in cell wall biosynthesis